MPWWKKAPPDRPARPRSILTGHDGSAEAVAIAPDSSWLVTASDDGTARTWAADGTPRATLTGHTDALEAVAIAPDGTWLVTASEAD
jgi:WD40 repeat protein